jgi:hypothetical protein
VSTRLGNSQGFAHDLGQPCNPVVPAATIMVKRFIHERDPGRRIGNYRVNGRIGHRAHHFQVVTDNDLAAQCPNLAL